MNYDNIVFPGKVDNLVEEPWCRNGAGGIVGIVQVKKLCLLQDILWNDAEIREK